MSATEEFLIKMWGEIQHGFGRLEEGQRQSRIASEQGRKDLHKRIDKLEEKVDRKHSPPRSSLGLLRVLGTLMAHWQPIFVASLMLLGFLGILKPDAAKKLIEMAKG